MATGLTTPDSTMTASPNVFIASSAAFAAVTNGKRVGCRKASK
jgi:hypothetical protein